MIFKARKAQSLIGSLTPSAWTYGRFIDEASRCLKSWKEFTNTGCDCSALSPHTSGHKPINVRCRPRSAMSCPTHHFTPTSQTHPPFCLVLYVAQGFSVSLCEITRDFLAVLPPFLVPCKLGVAKTKNAALWNCVFLHRHHQRVATYSVLAS